jgi:hypothetical protein
MSRNDETSQVAGKRRSDKEETKEMEIEREKLGVTPAQVKKVLSRLQERNTQLSFSAMEVTHDGTSYGHFVHLSVAGLPGKIFTWAGPFPTKEEARLEARNAHQKVASATLMYDAIVEEIDTLKS